MWNVKTKVVSVIIGATGAISKSLSQYLSTKLRHCEKTAILCTARILRIMLM